VVIATARPPRTLSGPRNNSFFFGKDLPPGFFLPPGLDFSFFSSNTVVILSLSPKVFFFFPPYEHLPNHQGFMLSPLPQPFCSGQPVNPPRENQLPISSPFRGIYATRPISKGNFCAPFPIGWVAFSFGPILMFHSPPLQPTCVLRAPPRVALLNRETFRSI